MGSNGKKKTTMQKLNRETKMREKRMEKEARREARKRAAANGTPSELLRVDAETLAAERQRDSIGI
jgi:hypothetical protein